MVPMYSLSNIERYWAILVALLIQMSKTPVAKGSSVPVCPALSNLSLVLII